MIKKALRSCNMNISELSIKRPSLVVVIFAVLGFLGFIGMQQLQYELLPRWDSPVFVVTTVYPGASPLEVENSVTRKIEDVISGLPDVDVVRSVSQDGFSMIIVMLNAAAEVDPIINDAVRKIQEVRNELPVYAKNPSVTNFSVNDLPVMTLGVNATLSGEDLYDLLEHQIKPRFSRIQGVGEISLIGATPREIQLNVNPRKLQNLNLSIMQVKQAIEASNYDYPAGLVENEEGQTQLRMTSRLSSVEDIRQLVIAYFPDGSFVRAGDVAEVTSASKEQEVLYRVNGQPSVGVLIQKNQDANAVSVSDALKTEMKRLEEEHGNISLKFSIPQDSSVVIKDAADSVINDLILAIILVTVMMILFMHSVRNAFIVMISVPLALISTFVGISLAGYTLNLMTLLALSLIIGTLVDDAIVVLENVYRHLEMGKNRWQATIDGVREVSLTVISTSLVLIVVFFPVALSESIISPIIAPFATVVVIAVMLSTITALTVIPLLTSRFARLASLKNSVWGRFITFFERGINAFSLFITSFLTWALRHKAVTLVSAILLFVASLILPAGGFIGSEFISMGDVGEGIVTLEYPKNYTLKQNNLITRDIEEYISQKPEIENTYTMVGQSSGLLSTHGGRYKSEINIKLVDKRFRDISTIRFVKNLENELSDKFAGVKVRSSVVGFIGGADEDPIQIIFRGINKDTLMAFAQQMEKAISGIPGTNNVKLSIEGGTPELVIRFDKKKMARLGVSPDVVGASIMTAFSGNTDQKILLGKYEYDIHIQLDDFNRRSVSDVESLPIINQMGQAVALKQFATITEETGTSRLERYSRISSVSLESQVIGRTVGDVGDDIIALLEQTPFPDGIDYLPESDLKYQGDAFGSLGLALLIAIVLVYLTMVALYESYLHPFVVLFSIPLSIIGAFVALALAQQTLSIFSMLGIIMLVGLVTKNAILVVDFINEMRKNGSTLVYAVVKGVRLRIRPVLMTAASTIIGMLPIALSQSTGSEWKSGLGWVLIGGITSSMFLSLIIVPVIYLLAEQMKGLMKGWFFSSKT
jgi:hydrophobic/amphiphilic exporter-1 (mainly G- bacteria), HAE1 family